MKKINELYETGYRTVEVPNADGLTMDKKQEEYLMPVHVVSVKPGLRFVHYILDLIVMQVLLAGFYLIAGIRPSTSENWLFGAAAIIVYYTFFEGLFSQSLGKMIVGSVVVNEYGEKIGIQTAFIRSLCRIVPFEAFSFLGDGRGWHDQWSNTYVLNKAHLQQLLAQAQQDSGEHIVNSMITD